MVTDASEKHVGVWKRYEVENEEEIFKILGKHLLILFKTAS